MVYPCRVDDFRCFSHTNHVCAVSFTHTPDVVSHTCIPLRAALSRGIVVLCPFSGTLGAFRDAKTVSLGECHVGSAQQLLPVLAGVATCQVECSFLSVDSALGHIV